MKVDGTEKLCIEQDTLVGPAQSFAGPPAVGVQFFHTPQSSAILGLTLDQALVLATQLINAVKEARS